MDYSTMKKAQLIEEIEALQERIAELERVEPERKRAEEAEREQRALAEALRDTAEVLSSTLDVDEVLDRILANVGRVVPHDAANIHLLDDNAETGRVFRIRGYAESNLEAPALDKPYRLVDVPTYCRMMTEGRQPVVVPYTQVDPDWVTFPDTHWISSYVSAPICLEGNVIGFLNLDSTTPGFFTTVHAKRLQAFADQAAIAIRNARLYEAAQQGITKHKRAEEALRRSEREKVIILDSMSELVAFHTLEMKILWANRATTAAFGLSVEELIGRYCYEAFNQRNKPCESCPVEKSLRTNQPQKAEMIFPDGRIWNIKSYPVQDVSGDVVGVIEVTENITERKRAEEALWESEERLAQSQRLAHLGSYQFKIPEGEVIWSDETYRIVERDPMKGAPSIEEYYQIIHPDDVPRVQRLLGKSIDEVKPFNFEYRIIMEDGSIKHIQSIGEPIANRFGIVERVVGTIHDITERKWVEEMKDNLIRDVTHELKTPLAKTQMSVELLMEMMGAPSIDRQKVARASEIVTGNVQRLQRTVNNILDLSSLESGRISYHKTKVQPENLIGLVILDMQPLAEAKGLELVAELPEGLPQVEGDREQLLRVLTNLVDNAVKFSDQGKIVVSAEEKAHEVEIAVSDSGRGILRENLDRVFEKFFQENPSIPGAGVGLAICKAIVEAHGGRIWAESAGRGQGATVRFSLPR